MKKRLLSAILLSVVLMTSVVLPFASAASEARDLKVPCKSLVRVDFANKTYTASIPFSGYGIGAISTKNYGNGVTANIVNVSWKAYPNTCTTTVSFSVKKTGEFDLLLLNDKKKVIFTKHFVVVVKNSSSQENLNKNYTVSHPNGVNLRSLPTTSGSTVKRCLNRGTVFTVEFTQDGWGWVPSLGGFVSLKYCKEVSSGSGSSSNSTSSSGLNRGAEMAFAQKNALCNSQWWCAEYVSRCLIAGGVDMPVITGCKTLYRKLDSMSGVTKYSLKVERNGKVLPQNNSCPITKGDAVIIYCNRCQSSYQHTVLVGDVRSSGVKVYAHNRAHKNDMYTAFNYCGECGGKNTTTYLFHFN